MKAMRRTVNTKAKNTAGQPRIGKSRGAKDQEVQSLIPKSVKKKTASKPSTVSASVKKAITATELKQHTADAIQSALKGPVTILKNGQPVTVLVSHEQFEHFIRLQKASLKKSFPFGIGANHPSLNDNGDDDDFFRPMTEAEYREFLEGGN
jgi:prevent-host-death family protein